MTMMLGGDGSWRSRGGSLCLIALVDLPVTALVIYKLRYRSGWHIGGGGGQLENLKTKSNEL
jgi:hypothetical protein